MDIFLEPRFYVLVLSNAVYQWGFDAYMTTFVDLALQIGTEKISAVNIMSVFAVVDLCGISYFCDRYQ